MEWIEVNAHIDTESVEAVSNILMEKGATGVSIEDDLDIENYEEDAFGEIIDKRTLKSNNGVVVVRAYFHETLNIHEMLPEIKAKITELENFGLSIGQNRVELNALEEESWADAWKKYYSPKRLTRFLTVVPSWENYEKEEQDEKLLILDPGMAFGTGTHPTTHLTLQALESVLRGGEEVIDVGSGSGVLSIACSKLGAKKIFAYDLDEVAVEQTKENIRLNPEVKNIEVNTGNLLQGIDKKVDVIVGNILADILVMMFADAKNVLKENGKMILSGIINEKLTIVAESLEENGFVIETRLNQGEWNALIVAKNRDQLQGVVGG